MQNHILQKNIQAQHNQMQNNISRKIFLLNRIKCRTTFSRKIFKLNTNKWQDVSSHFAIYIIVSRMIPVIHLLRHRWYHCYKNTVMLTVAINTRLLLSFFYRLQRPIFCASFDLLLTFNIYLICLNQNREFLARCVIIVSVHALLYGFVLCII